MVGTPCILTITGCPTAAGVAPLIPENRPNPTLLIALARLTAIYYAPAVSSSTGSRAASVVTV